MRRHWPARVGRLVRFVLAASLLLVPHSALKAEERVEGLLDWFAPVPGVRRDTFAGPLGAFELREGKLVVLTQTGVGIVVSTMDEAGTVLSRAALPMGWSEPFGGDETGVLYASRRSSNLHCDLMKFDVRTGLALWPRPVRLTGTLASGGFLHSLLVAPNGDAIATVRGMGAREPSTWEIWRVDGIDGVARWRLCQPAGLDGRRAPVVRLDRKGDLVILGRAVMPGKGDSWAVFKFAGLDGSLLWGPFLVTGDEGSATSSADVALGDESVFVTGQVVFDGLCRWVTVKLSARDGRPMWGPVVHSFRDSAWSGRSEPETARVDSHGDVVISSRFDLREYAKLDGATGRLRWLTRDPGGRKSVSWALDPAGNVVVSGTYHSDSNDFWKTWNLQGDTGAEGWGVALDLFGRESRPYASLQLASGRIAVLGRGVDIETNPYRWIARAAVQIVDSSSGTAREFRLEEEEGVTQQRPLAAYATAGGLVVASMEGVAAMLDAATGRKVWGPVEMGSGRGGAWFRASDVDVAGDLVFAATEVPGTKSSGMTIKLAARTGAVLWRSPPVPDSTVRSVAFDRTGDVLEIGDVDVPARPIRDEDEAGLHADLRRSVVRKRSGSNGEILWSSEPLCSVRSESVSIASDGRSGAFAVVRCGSDDPGRKLRNARSVAVGIVDGHESFRIDLGADPVVGVRRDKSGHFIVLLMSPTVRRAWTCLKYDARGLLVWSRVEEPEPRESRTADLLALDQNGDVVVVARTNDGQGHLAWRVTRCAADTGRTLWERSIPVEWSLHPAYSLPQPVPLSAMIPAGSKDLFIAGTGALMGDAESGSVLLKLSAVTGETLWSLGLEAPAFSGGSSGAGLIARRGEVWLATSRRERAVVCHVVESLGFHATGPALPAGREGQPYSVDLGPVNGRGPLTVTLANGTLPPGLALTESGVVRGTPDVAGRFPISVKASDRASSVTRTYVLDVFESGDAPRSSNVGWARPNFDDSFTSCAPPVDSGTHIR